MMHPDGANRPASDVSALVSGYVQESRDRWTFRRVMIFGAAIVLALLLGYLTVFGDGQNGVQVMLASALPLAFVSLVALYIGAPIADDWLQLRVPRTA